MDEYVPLPPPTKVPCVECPWLRSSRPGHLGPYAAEDWHKAAHSDQAIACHMTIKPEDGSNEGKWDDGIMRQCAGAAIYRANSYKTSRNPEVTVLPQNTDLVFAFDEFVNHHNGTN